MLLASATAMDTAAEKPALPDRETDAAIESASIWEMSLASTTTPVCAETVLLFRMAAVTLLVSVLSTSETVPAPLMEKPAAPLTEMAAATPCASIKLLPKAFTCTALALLVAVEWSIAAVVCPPTRLSALVIASEMDMEAPPAPESPMEAAVTLASISCVSVAFTAIRPGAVTLLLPCTSALVVLVSVLVTTAPVAAPLAEKPPAPPPLTATETPLVLMVASPSDVTFTPAALLCRVAPLTSALVWPPT